jgi:hypothetical protein
MKGGKDIQFNKSITLPSYIHDVAKVRFTALGGSLAGRSQFRAAGQVETK